MHQTGHLHEWRSSYADLQRKFPFMNILAMVIDEYHLWKIMLTVSTLSSPSCMDSSAIKGNLQPMACNMCIEHSGSSRKHRLCLGISSTVPPKSIHATFPYAKALQRPLTSRHGFASAYAAPRLESEDSQAMTSVRIAAYICGSSSVSRSNSYISSDIPMLSKGFTK